MTATGPDNLAGVANLVVEMENVLLVPEARSVHGVLPRRVSHTRPWREYEKGVLSRDETCRQLADLHGVPVNTIHAVADTRLVWNPAPDLERLLDVLAASGRRLYCVANVPREEWKIIEERYAHIWQMFEQVTVSCETGVTRPSPGVFRRLASMHNLGARETLFLDEGIENLQFARALGWHSLRYRGPQDLARRLGTYRPESGLRAAEDHLAGALASGAYATTWYPGTGNIGRALYDNYSPLLMLHENDQLAAQPAAVGLLAEIHALRTDGLIPFFQDGKLPPDVEPMPLDVDDTSLLYATLHRYRLFGVDEREVDRAAARIATNTSDDGIIQIYFDLDRPRIDPVVCANALYLVHLAQRGPQARPTEDHVYALMQHRAYQDGTLYFPSPDIFLYFVYRLVRQFPALEKRFAATLHAGVADRIGASLHPLELAMRTIMCHGLGIPNRTDPAHLLARQHRDGSWPPSPFLLYPSAPATGYNRTLETAFAALALRMDSSEIGTR